MSAGIRLLARAVIRDRDQFLLAHALGSVNTFLPGGHVELGESLAQTLVREIAEELGVACQVGAYLGLIEHTWTRAGHLHHEIDHCFVVEAPALIATPTRSKERHLEFLWVHAGELGRHNLQPYPLVGLIGRWCAGDSSLWHASTIGAELAS